MRFALFFFALFSQFFAFRYALKQALVSACFNISGVFANALRLCVVGAGSHFEFRMPNAFHGKYQIPIAPLTGIEL